MTARRPVPRTRPPPRPTTSTRRRPAAPDWCRPPDRRTPRRWSRPRWRSRSGKTENPLGDDVALDLRRSGRDRVGERVEVLLQPGALRFVDAEVAVDVDRADLDRECTLDLGCHQGQPL